MGTSPQFVKLSWRILEYKLMYYCPELIAKRYHKKLTAPDWVYDMLCKQYLQLCVILGYPNSLVHQPYDIKGAEATITKDTMLEPDLDRPSVQLILSKYGGK